MYNLKKVIVEYSCKWAQYLFRIKGEPITIVVCL